MRAITTRGRRFGRKAAAGLLAVALIGSLAACANDPLADQYRAGDNKGFIAGDSRWVEVPEAERGEPVEFAGTTETGQAVSSADFAGQVLVVNFWYAACGPCRAEAGELEDAYAAFEGDDVSFLGINTSDSAEAAAAFAKDYGVTYPSVITVDDRSVKLAFAERTPISATPTTLVLDTEGRVASRIIGQLPDASILEALVRDALGES